MRHVSIIPTLLLFLLIQNFFVLIDKKRIVFIEKDSDSENLIALVLISNICQSKNRNKIKRKKIKKTKISWMKPLLKNRNNKIAYVNIFPELLLKMKNKNFAIIFKWILHQTIDRTLIFVYSILIDLVLLVLILLHHILIFKIHYSTRF